ncbi:hypothetical protein BJV74DRAFT_962586 [Russula compacta]|nr:hypothetical protein BJV74DRAFT_962586 [Russula compacta]
MTPQYSHLLPPPWRSQVAAWLDEDTPSLYYGGFVVGEAPRDAFLLGKGSRRACLQAHHSSTRSSAFLDVEVRDEDEANDAIAAGADVTMLDNIEGNELASVAQRLREYRMSEGKKFLLVTSGSITESNLRERDIAEIAISRTSSVHQSVPHIDFTFEDPDASQFHPYIYITNRIY